MQEIRGRLSFDETWRRGITSLPAPHSVLVEIEPELRPGCSPWSEKGATSSAVASKGDHESFDVRVLRHVIGLDSHGGPVGDMAAALMTAR